MKTNISVVATTPARRMKAMAIVCVASMTFAVGNAAADIVTYGFVSVDGTGLNSEGESDASLNSRSIYVESDRYLYATDSLLSYRYADDGSLTPFTSFAGLRADNGALGAFASSGRIGRAAAVVFWNDSMQLLPPPSLPPGEIVPSLDSLDVWFEIQGSLATTAVDGGSSDAEIAADLNGYRFVRTLQSQSIPLDGETSTYSVEEDSQLIDTRVKTVVNLTNGVGNLAYDLSVVSSSYRGSGLSDFFGTLKLDSITFADGSTPESHGYTLAFASGMASPNVSAVPEPSSLASLGIGMLVFIVGRIRRRTLLALA